MKAHYGPSAPLPWWQWAIIGVLLLCQGSWLFLDARRRGARAWLWGVWGLTTMPMPLLVYWLVVIRPRRAPSGKQ
ncbi:MAG: transcriptional regulator [Mycobacterium leprae]